MEASKILTEAADLVSGHRRQAYGDAYTHLAYVARMWSTFLEVEITAKDVCHLLLLLKMTRQETGEYHRDNYVDMAGYAGLAGEVAERMNNNNVEIKRKS